MGRGCSCVLGRAGEVESIENVLFGRVGGVTVADVELRQSCSSASGAQQLGAVLAGCASWDDQKRQPQKVDRDVEHVPHTALLSSCGTATMQGVDVRRIFWLCTVACLVFRDALQKRGLEFVTLCKCVQALHGHGVCEAHLPKMGPGGKMCGGEQAHWVGGQRLPAHTTFSASCPQPRGGPGAAFEAFVLGNTEVKCTCSVQRYY